MPSPDGPPRPGSNAPDPQLTAVYQELILDHYRRPRNRGRLDHPDAAALKKNPLCGDEIELQLSLDGDVVREVRFAGQGCAISQASASMMTQLVTGKPLAEVEQMAQRFAAMVNGDAAAAADRSLGEARSLAGVSRLPVRHPCALLGWNALAEALAKRG